MLRLGARPPDLVRHVARAIHAGYHAFGSLPKLTWVYVLLPLALPDTCEKHQDELQRSAKRHKNIAP